MVNLSGQNYRRRALLEGSHDGRVWEVVAEEVWLFDVSLPGQNFKVDAIKFPTNNFRYLRLTVYNMTDDPRRITIEAVKGAFQRAEMEKELVPVPVKQIVVSHDEKKNQTVIELDLAFRNLPVANLQVETPPPIFIAAMNFLGGMSRRREFRARQKPNGTPLSGRFPGDRLTGEFYTGFSINKK